MMVRIVGGNGRFEVISRAYDQGTHKDYLEIKQDAINKGIDPAILDTMRKPVLVRRISEPFDTRQLGLHLTPGMSATIFPILSKPRLILIVLRDWKIYSQQITVTLH